MFDFMSDKLSSVFSRLTGQGYLTEKNIEHAVRKIKDTLLEADVPYQVVVDFIDQLKKEVVGKKILTSLKPAEYFTKLMHDQLVQFLGGKKDDDAYTFDTSSTIMLMGLQGSGKTTTIAKLAHMILTQAKKKKPVIVFGSIDFYRPAAVDQLEILAEQIGVQCYRAQATDPVQAAAEIAAHAKSVQADYLFLDTAGRLHVDDAMLDELVAVDAQVKPTHKLLVLDAMTGQESLRVAQAFNERIGFEGALLTKIDSDTRSGSAFAFGYMLKKPILFLGVGEKVDELERFRPERIATRMLGMGDIQTLIERANQKINQSEQEAAEKAFAKGRLTLDDFARQMSMMNKMGSLSQLMRYIPGMSSQALSGESIERAEKEMKRFKAIIASMTRKERLNHKMLDGSRRKRVARGAGVAVTDVNLLLRRFEEMQQFAKLFKKMGSFPGF